MAQIGNNGNELTLVIPNEGTKPWYAIIYALYTKISQHDHTGNGNGAQLGTNSIANDSINDLKIRLRNNEWLRARNITNTADLNILKINNSNELVISETSQKTIIDSELEINGETTLTEETNITANLNAQTANFTDIEADSLDVATVTADYSENAQLVLPPKVDSITPVEGELMVSDGTDRAKGLWVYQDSTWTAPTVPDEGITTNKIADLNVTTEKLADESVTFDKVELEILNKLAGPGAVNGFFTSGATVDIDNSMRYLEAASSISSTTTFNLSETQTNDVFILVNYGGTANIVINGVGGQSETINLIYYPSKVLIHILAGSNYNRLVVTAIPVGEGLIQNQGYEIVSVAGPDLRDGPQNYLLNVTAATGSPAIRCRPGQILRLWKATTGNATVTITVDGSTGASVTVAGDSIRTVHVMPTSVILENNTSELQTAYT